MRRSLALAFAAVLLLLASPVPAASAVGGTPSCSHREWLRVHRGDTLTRVQRILDGRGRLDSVIGDYQSRAWGNFGKGFCRVHFEGKRVTDKSWYR